MPAMATITVYDGESTPVIHQFKAVTADRDNGQFKAEYREILTDVGTSAHPRIILSSQVLRSGVTKVDVEVMVPIQEVITGSNAAGYSAAPKVAHTPRGKCTFFFDERATAQERANVRMIMSNVLRGITTSAASIVGPGPQIVDEDLFPY